MRREIIISFEVPEELEHYDIHYAGIDGSLQIAHEMILCAVKEHQLEILERASAFRERGDEETSNHVKRFFEAQKTLKIEGLIHEDKIRRVK